MIQYTDTISSSWSTVLRPSSPAPLIETTSRSHATPFHWSKCPLTGTLQMFTLRKLAICCTQRHINSMCLVFPKPRLDAIALVAFESVHVLPSAFSSRSDMNDHFPSPSTASYSDSATFQTRDAGDLDQCFTNVQLMSQRERLVAACCLRPVASTHVTFDSLAQHLPAFFNGVQRPCVGFAMLVRHLVQFKSVQLCLSVSLVHFVHQSVIHPCRSVRASQEPRHLPHAVQPSPQTGIRSASKSTIILCVRRTVHRSVPPSPPRT